MYSCPNVYTEHYDVFTNAGPCAAFRAPGQVQGIFGLEQMLDELAEKIGMDPLDLRAKIDTSGSQDCEARAVERRIGAERFGWKSRKAANADSGPMKRGMG
jgi:xanthine dehydrogenase YagR molybdenum-binding subunit